MSLGPQNQQSFAGLQNYIKLFSDSNFAPFFWRALRNNFVFFAVHMLVQNPIGLMLAALLAEGGRLRNFFRTVIFMPTVLSVVIIGFIWQLILNPLWGVAEGMLEAVGLGAWFGPWLGKPETALVTVSLISVWQFVGIPMILFYAALIGIPDELTEAARVDGATAWDTFWRIKFPLILPTVGHRGRAHLRGQLQRLRPHLHHEGRQRRARLCHRHHGHTLLPDVLRAAAPAGEPHHGRHRRRHDVPDHPHRRFAVHVPVGTARPDL